MMIALICLSAINVLVIKVSTLRLGLFTASDCGGLDLECGSEGVREEDGVNIQMSSETCSFSFLIQKEKNTGIQECFLTVLNVTEIRKHHCHTSFAIAT